MSRVMLAMKGVDVCVHTAAMKNINMTEYNVPELIHTNVTGTQNLVLSAIEQGVRHFIFVSSDKAVNPTTAYGAIYEAPHLLRADQIKMVGLRNKGRTPVPEVAHDGQASNRIANLIKRYLDGTR